MRGMKQLPIERTADLQRPKLTGPWRNIVIRHRGYKAMITLLESFTLLGPRRVRRLRNQLARAIRLQRSP